MKVFLTLFVLMVLNLALGQTSDSIIQVSQDLESFEKFMKEEIMEMKGKVIPPFELTLLNGEFLSSENLKGKPSIINFWFTSCEPCLEEIPLLMELKQEFNSDVNFIAITFQRSEEISAFLAKHQFDFVHLVDSRDYIKKLGIKAYPKTLVLDQDLTIARIEKLIPKDPKNQENNREAFKERITSHLIEILKR